MRKLLICRSTTPHCCPTAVVDPIATISIILRSDTPTFESGTRRHGFQIDKNYKIISNEKNFVSCFLVRAQEIIFRMLSIKSISMGQPAIAAKQERSPVEKSLVRRLDIFLMTFGCISQGKSLSNVVKWLVTFTDEWPYLQ